MRLMISLLFVMLSTSSAYSAQKLSHEPGSASYYCRPEIRTFCNRSSCIRETSNVSNSEFSLETKNMTLGACLATDCYAGKATVIYDPVLSYKFTADGMVKSERPAGASPPPGLASFHLLLAIDMADTSFTAVWGAAGDGVIIDMGSCREKVSIQFAYDSIQLDPAARRKLNVLAGLLSGSPALRMNLIGHTDDRGTSEYSLALGEQMARAVAAYMTRRGVAVDRMVTLSHGKERPVDRRHTAAARAKNRRVEVVLFSGK